MAAFCGCCGALITGKAEACPVCGTPRHGMLSLDPPSEPRAHQPPKHLFACELRKETTRPKGIAG
jgi:hypothetical protein